MCPGPPHGNLAVKPFSQNPQVEPATGHGSAGGDQKEPPPADTHETMFRRRVHTQNQKSRSRLAGFARYVNYHVAQLSHVNILASWPGSRLCQVCGWPWGQISQISQISRLAG